MKLLVFNLTGPMAHFRKFYTNSSSLSYPIPPRTTLVGLIAGVLGRERDSYYEEFSTESCYLAVSKVSQTRSIMQTVNYMKITTPKHFSSPEDHTQIPFEILVGREGDVVFQIYFHHRDPQIMEELARMVQNNQAVYPPYLGNANFLGKLEWVGEAGGKWQQSDEFVSISSVVPIDSIKERGVKIASLDQRSLMILKERMPRAFGEGREIREVKSYLFEELGRPMEVRLKESYLLVKNEEVEKNILFL
ncbi:MAG: type I-B CRISPR-associated protein Cas5b [Clostridia bacterium]|nr:type I-B CRISPR-associated protein Cas5b [Clostridia bacterium]